MVKVTHEAIIARPAERVFAALNDFAGSPRWQPAVIREWHEPAGPIGVGTRIHQARTFMGRRIESVGVVTAYEPNRRLANERAPESPADEPTFRTDYRAEPLGSHTRVHFTIELRGRGAFRLLTPLVRRGLARDVTTRFRTLTALLEGESTA